MELYAWARGLRVAYGLLGVWLVYLIARRIGLDRAASLAAALLAALAPMSVAVTHFATGDIGTDFFGAISVFLLALHLRSRRAVWLFLSGLMLAWAFAAKYNGALVLVPALYLAGLLVLNRRGLRGFFGDAFVYALGGITGLLSAIPQLVWAPDKTISDMIRIFHFIKTYHVAPEFAAKPFTERAAFTLSNNLPPLLGHLGPIVCVLAGIAAAAALVELLRARRAPGRPDLAPALLRFALFSSRSSRRHRRVASPARSRSIIRSYSSRSASAPRTRSRGCGVPAAAPRAGSRSAPSRPPRSNPASAGNGKRSSGNARITSAWGSPSSNRSTGRSSRRR